MEVITIESETYKEQEARLRLLEKLFLQVVAELRETKNDRWIGVKEVREFTGFSTNWIMARKLDFGFFQDGKDLKFYKPNVMAYMISRSIDPKINKQVAKLRKAL